MFLEQCPVDIAVCIFSQRIECKLSCRDLLLGRAVARLRIAIQLHTLRQVAHFPMLRWFRLPACRTLNASRKHGNATIEHIHVYIEMNGCS